MTEFCKHHPREAAHWHCSHCDSFYCDDCIVKRTGGYMDNASYFFCPACNKYADWIAAENAIEPFWERLHTLFVYPFKNIQTIIFIVVLALAGAFLSKPGIIGSLVLILLFVFQMKYAFTVMGETARGALLPPDVNLKTLSENKRQAFTPVILTGALVFLCFFIGESVGIVAGLIGMIVCFISLPSMIMAYMAGGRFYHAIHPGLFVGIMVRIGAPYLLMVFFLLLFLLAPNALVYAFKNVFPESGQLFLYSIANSYYTIIFYHLMGYVLLQYHQQIGYTVNQEEFILSKSSVPVTTPLQTDPAFAIEEKVELLAKEGKYDQALEYIKNECEGEISTPGLSRQYYRLLNLRNDPDLSEHLPCHLRLMIRDNDKKEACAAYRKSLLLKKGGGLQSPELIKLAGWLNEAGAYKEAISAYNKIITGQPDNEFVPMAYFRAACILHNNLGNPEKAGKIFSLLKKKYPMADIIPHVEKFLSDIRRAG